jgi:hypothetical protein
VAVRSRTGGDLGARSVADFLGGALDEIARKASAPERPAA